MLAGLIAVQLAVAGVAVARHDPPAPPPRRPVSARPAVVVPEREQAVRALLAQRSEAVRRHDRTAFLATVEPGPFATRQAQLYDALAQLPFAQWDYELVAASSQPASRALDVRRGQWWSPETTLVYALRGFDEAPVRRREQLTFVERQGRWLVAADDDFPAVATGRDLWDDGPTLVIRTLSCLIAGHPRRATLVRSLAAQCDAAIPRVSAVWGDGWARQVVLLVPDDARELTRLVPEAGDLSQIAAVASAEITGSRPSADRVLVDPAVFERLGPLGRRIVLTHEVTHVASRAATGSQLPTWMSEGLADYVGYLGTGVPVEVAASELQVAVRAGRLPTHLPDDAAFDGSRKDLAQSYESSWLAIRVLVDRYGQAGMLAFYRAVGSDTRPGAVGRALAAVGSSTTAFTADWRADLRHRLG